MSYYLRPDELQFGFQLSELQGQQGLSKESLATIRALQQLPPPLGDDPWRLRLAGDMAPRYFNWALALGKYH